KKIAIASVGCLICSLAKAESLSGVSRVVDGDTLVIGETKVRIEGIDAPETDQICLNASGVRWNCGIEARDRLAAHIGGQKVICAPNGIDAYGRTLATCRLNGENLSAWLVREGWALAYVKYSSAYRDFEEEARMHKRGLWQGAFIAPWDWRHRNDKTQILGAFSVPKDSQALLVPRSATASAPSPDCTIKGNISRNGERIYHMPDQRYYARIRMDSGGGRRWFCTAEEAEAAGWRRALR